MREPMVKGGGVTLWLDAGESSTVISDYWGNVIEWKDKSENAANFQQRKREACPRTGLRSIHGQNVISFDGMNSFIHGLKDIKVGSVFIVALVDNGYEDMSGLFCEHLKNENNIRLGDNHEFVGNYGTNSRDLTNAGGQMFINGLSSQKISTQTPFLLTAFPAEAKLFNPNLSQNFFDDRFWKGDIGEVIILDHRADEEEQAGQQSYLTAKWKI